MVFEASGIDETTNGVAGQVAESQGDASEVECVVFLGQGEFFFL